MTSYGEEAKILSSRFDKDEEIVKLLGSYLLFPAPVTLNDVQAIVLLVLFPAHWSMNPKIVGKIFLGSILRVLFSRSGFNRSKVNKTDSFGVLSSNLKNAEILF